MNDSQDSPTSAEATDPAEDQAIRELLENSERLHDGSGQEKLRAQHSKGHGCLLAEFVVEDGLPDSYRVGVFREARTFAALIRFSNGARSDDRQADIHGMAIKLLGVEGVKVLEAEKNAETQDFVLADHPAFFIRNSHEYVRFSKALIGTKNSLLGKVAFGLRIMFSPFAPWSKLRRSLGGPVPDSPLRVRYWSQTPYRFGHLMAKYSARPDLAIVPAPAASDSPDRLRLAMAAHLAVEEARFDFEVQLRTDPAAMPVEDPTVEWPESASPPRKVATIRIPAQHFDTPAIHEFCEGLSFTPWHTLPEHTPLGSINRARRTIYQVLADQRLRARGVGRHEPSISDIPSYLAAVPDAE